MRPLLDEMLTNEFLARTASEAIARAAQGAELLRHSTPEVIDVFMKTRLGGSVNCWGAMFGTLGSGVTRADKMVERARVKRQ
jgi:putative acyl-CoA dehydrogenase